MYDELAIGLRYCLSRADAELEPFKVFGGVSFRTRDECLPVSLLFVVVRPAKNLVAGTLTRLSLSPVSSPDIFTD